MSVKKEERESARYSLALYLEKNKEKLTSQEFLALPPQEQEKVFLSSVKGWGELLMLYKRKVRFA